jgi:hypothetical protein
MDFVKKNAKAIATFLAAVLLQAIADAVNSGKIPSTLSEWGSYLVTALITATVVWLTGNKLDLGQILAGMRDLDVPEQQQVAEQTLDTLPNPVSDEVVAGYPNWTNG